jgi:hydroxyacylglutathione hydrolase
MDLKIETVPVGALETNCYLVSAEGETAVIDPGGDAKEIFFRLRENPRYILITHGHFDHVLVLDELTDKYKTTQVLAGDVGMIKKLNMQEGFYGVTFPKIRTKITPVNDGLKIPFGSAFIEVIATPGHTPQGVSYRIEDKLFTGDTLFAGAHGRVDLPGSDYSQMQESLRKLGKLPPETEVYPGHGAATTIVAEMERGLLF